MYVFCMLDMVLQIAVCSVTLYLAIEMTAVIIVIIAQSTALNKLVGCWIFKSRQPYGVRLGWGKKDCLNFFYDVKIHFQCIKASFLYTHAD